MAGPEGLALTPGGRDQRWPRRQRLLSLLEESAPFQWEAWWSTYGRPFLEALSYHLLGNELKLGTTADRTLIGRRVGVHLPNRDQ
jgi:hypothetical protein